MRLIFAGTPEFALVALQQLHGAGHEVALVLTQPDRPAGRGLKLRASPVKQFALAHRIAVAQPRSLRLDGKYPGDAAAVRGAVEAAQADVMVVAAYGLILPQWVLDAPRWGCLNIHASLLPRWRGAAPIQRAIEAGDRESGVTIMQMDAGLDTGAMLLVERVPIAARETGASLHDKLAQMGGQLIVQSLARASGNGLAPVPQPAAGVSYAHKIDKQEALIDWRRPAPEIERQIRAFDPFPGAASRLGPESIKLWNSEIDSELSISDNGHGTILSANPGGVRVACGSGVLRVTELQRAGGKRLAAADFLRGYPLTPGMRFAP
ncbi:MAG: methionyl-tRNA formyltransferase [Burkholderiales bacterium]|nr:methionyl-tRNA formyltransferase [Burkholderiales bacterium]